MSSAALRDKISISQEELFFHEDEDPSTTTVLDLRNDKFPISKKSNSPMRWQLVDYYGTWLKLRQDLYFPRGIIHAIRWQPIDYYSTRPYEDTRLLITKRNFSSMRQQFVDYYGTRLKLRQDLYFPRGFIHPWGDNSSTTTVLDSSWDKISISQEDLFIHEVTIRRLLQYLTQAETIYLFLKRIYSSTRCELIDYYGTQSKPRQDLLFLKGTIRPWDDKQIDYYGTQRRKSR